MDSDITPWRQWAVTLTASAAILFGVPGVYSLLPGPPAPIPLTEKRALPPSGGTFFTPRLVLPVPSFLQADKKWGPQPMGPAGDTLASAGCAVCSTAMILASYGIDTDPPRLNAWLTANGGYTEKGWLQWESAAALAPGKAKFAYEDLPSYQLIDDNLSRGNPVIIRIRFASGGTHFVVICGKDGLDYLIRDPGQAGAKGVYPLKNFGSPIEALRFYERLPAAG